MCTHYERIYFFSAALFLSALLAAGCAGESAPEVSATADAEVPSLETRADSVAMQLYEALGGPEAWQSLPYLRFTFAVGQEGERQPVAHHLWNRQTGDYRLEWEEGSDSSYVALFNTDTQEGQVYLNGESVDSSENDELLEQAYRRFINDTYWFLAPVKVFDEGVRRAYVADSSDAETDVIRLTFEDVGLTPGDRYWLYVDEETGMLDRWAFHLQGMPEDASPRFSRWTGYETLSAPAGSVRVATRKEAVGGDGAIYTDNVEAPTDVPEALFTDPAASLHE